MALSKTTQDHDEIRQWAEKRGGKPAEVASTSENGTGIIRIEFPGAAHANDSNLEEISWEQFFEKFDASGLSLIYQDITADGEQSNFNRFAYPENISPSTVKSSRNAGRKAAPAKTGAKQTTAAKKTLAKSTAKKTAPPAKKAAAKKTAAKKAPTAKKAAAKTSARPAAKTSGAARKSAAAKKAPAKKTAVKKAPAKKTTRAGAQRAAVAVKKKTSAKKSTRR